MSYSDSNGPLRPTVAFCSHGVAIPAALTGQGVIDKGRNLGSPSIKTTVEPYFIQRLSHPHECSTSDLYQNNSSKNDQHTDKP